MATEASKLKEAISEVMRQSANEHSVTKTAPRAQKSVIRKARWRVFFHPDVDKTTEKQPVIRRRVALIMRHLAAHGRTAILKGCAESENKDWLRAPAGGNTGNQFYLWLQILGDRQIFVRALRHHDDHTPLKLGVQDDYLEMPAETIADSEWFESPWSRAQNEAIGCQSDCISLIGMPGAGKTSAAWERVIRRARNRALYLTYSNDLAEHARGYFEAFLTEGQEVLIMSTHHLISEISGTHIAPGVVRANRHIMSQVASLAPPEARSRWGRLGIEIYCEMRGRYLGLAPLSDKSKWRTGHPGKLPPGEYRERFSGAQSDQRDNVEVVIKMASTLERNGQLQRLFPELAAAARARRRIHQGFLPPGLEECDLVVLDEAQDLTIAEMAVVTDLVKAIGKKTGQRPSLMIAGDESQTIRPTAFDWSYVHDLLYQEGLGKSQEIAIQGNQRCPKGISDVVDRATAYYKHLGKCHRPSHATATPIMPASNGKIRLVCENDSAAAVEALKILTAMDGVAVVSAAFEKPAWISSEIWDKVLTPESIKGLEYQSVIVIDPLSEILECDGGKGSDQDDVATRTDIDRLRVCLSRATELLAGFLVRGHQITEDRTRSLFEGAIEVSIQELVGELEGQEVSLEEKVLERIDRSRAILSAQPFHAVRVAAEALELLGDRGLPGGVHSIGIRRDAAETFLTTLMTAILTRVHQCSDRDPELSGWHLADEIDQPDQRFQVWTAGAYRLAKAALRETGEENQDDELARRMADALEDPKIENAIFLYLHAFRTGLGKDGWLSVAVRQCGQDLSDDVIFAVERSTAGAKIAAEADFLDFIDEYLTEVGAQSAWMPSHEIVEIAVERLVDDREYAAAEHIVRAHMGSDPSEIARIRLSQKRFKDAAELYEQAGLMDAALRAWRKAGCIEIVSEKATGRTKEELGWILRLESLMREKNKPKSLTPAEMERLETALQSLKTLTKNTHQI